MPKTPIEMVLNGVAWVAMEGDSANGDGLPYATHEGVLEIGDIKMKCYRLSTGQAVIAEDDMIKFFEGLADGDIGI